MNINMKVGKDIAFVSNENGYISKRKNTTHLKEILETENKIEITEKQLEELKNNLNTQKHIFKMSLPLLIIINISSILIGFHLQLLQAAILFPITFTFLSGYIAVTFIHETKKIKLQITTNEKQYQDYISELENLKELDKSEDINIDDLHFYDVPLNPTSELQMSIQDDIDTLAPIYSIKENGISRKRTKNKQSR